MKAVVVKNNQFETIGFEVRANAKTLFSWGVAPVVSMYFIKEVDVDDWMPEIFKLVRIQSTIQEKGRFESKFFSTAEENGILEDGKGINFSAEQKEREVLQNQLENIIKNII
mgnify:CR=1 FL=1